MYKHLDCMIARWQIKVLRSLGKPNEGEAIYIKRTTISQEMAQQYHQKELIQLHEVPKEYQKYKEVFLEERARRFPPDRNLNATVELLPGAPEQLDCKVYPLTKPEMETLKKFLSEELEKGFIEELASPYTAPVFLINKKNSVDKRKIIDYQNFNQWTKRGNGPLPRIDQLLQQMEGKEIFSKFDIRWGYNNILIEEGD
jgi:hypothetical protein